MLSKTSKAAEKFTEKSKRRSQVGVKLTKELHARLRNACEIQNHREGQLAYILLEWALEFYENLRSMEVMQRFNVKRAKSKYPDIFARKSDD